jgi:excisionase family DNA binding protein
MPNEQGEARAPVLDALPEVLTVDELSTALRIGRDSGYALVNSGAINAKRIGRCWRIPLSALHDYLDGDHE